MDPTVDSDSTILFIEEKPSEDTAPTRESKRNTLRGGLRDDIDSGLGAFISSYLRVDMI